MKDWQRGDWFDSGGLPWINPSPNMRSLNAALLYPGVAMLEYAKNYSVGRGTDAPFEQIGADFIHGPELAAYLNGAKSPACAMYAHGGFKPAMEGVRFVITNRDAFDSTRLGLEIAAALAKALSRQDRSGYQRETDRQRGGHTRTGGGRRSAGHSAEDGGQRNGVSEDAGEIFAVLDHSTVTLLARLRG